MQSVPRHYQNDARTFSVAGFTFWKAPDATMRVGAAIKYLGMTSKAVRLQAGRMQSDSASISASNMCVLKVRRIGDAEGEPVGTQSRTDIPPVGEILEVTVNGSSVRARVYRVDVKTVEGTVIIEADELSQTYAWDALSAMVQFHSVEGRGGGAESAVSLRPHLAFDATLRLVRQSHALARRFLERPKPDIATALRYMKAARRAAWLAFPYVKDEELKRRIVGYQPMSEAEWEQLWPSH
jgi:hypothetical protein